MYIKRILRVLIPGVTVSVSDSRIFVSFMSHVPVSSDLDHMFWPTQILHFSSVSHLEALPISQGWG